MKAFLNTIFLVIFMTIASNAQTCNAPTKKGTPCRNRVKEVGIHCHLHRSAAETATFATSQSAGAQKSATATQCTGQTKSGQQCRNKTKNVNGRCHLHQ